ncbi:SanA protein [Desulfoprunum benzoelyticum]|uniref:SanA protein n=1 Tax=Desulfoprunum benzoelyticum TaxID=1506996 RepID=A0A840UY43_9BACT|nr:ElyC/SanA/YdcF family protein [Desulfoprunum benzoelyticum]MBB5347578.1 SanA protein [Desulfoprunum benzoelyticum]
MMVNTYSRFTYDTVDEIAPVYSAIVLGTSKKLKNGRENQYYKNRILAAVQLYQANKCKKIIVSGDNRTMGYNEPRDMKSDLILLGVPAEVIVCDYAGRRTLDSIIRFKEIFGQTAGIVVSQQFHNNRAVFIGRHKGIRLNGFNAEDVNVHNGLKTRVRELVSKLFCVLDVKIFNTRPRHLGDKIVI